MRKTQLCQKVEQMYQEQSIVFIDYYTANRHLEANIIQHKQTLNDFVVASKLTMKTASNIFSQSKRYANQMLEVYS